MTRADPPRHGDGAVTGTDVADMVRSVIEDNVYMVLGTADEAGRPWVSPVFYSSHACRDFFWISSPEVTHSRNLAGRPQVSIVIFDSRAPVGTGGASAVYMAGTAAAVRDHDLDRTSPPTRTSPAVGAGSSRRGPSLARPVPPLPGHCDRTLGPLPSPRRGALRRSWADYDHRTRVDLP